MPWPAAQAVSLVARSFIVSLPVTFDLHDLAGAMELPGETDGQ